MGMRDVFGHKCKKRYSLNKVLEAKSHASNCKDHLKLSDVNPDLDQDSDSDRDLD